MGTAYPNDKQGILDWFSQFGATDPSYFQAHYDRWVDTKAFALEGVHPTDTLNILDIGAHWLHNAYLYASEGHNLICMDAPDTFELQSVKNVASELGMDLVPTRRMETGDGLDVIPDDSVDIILFCEIIEHLTFNPIPFWKQVYRVLKVGGRIIVTTPNSFYYKNLNRHFDDMEAGTRIGISLEDIMGTGTYGHHWKEFCLPELNKYFAMLSPDFDTSRYKMIELKEDVNVNICGAAGKVDRNVNVRAHNIYLGVTLKSKSNGIVISPPWIPI